MKEPNDGVERLAIRDRYANTIHTTSATPADQHLSRHTICVYGANRHTSQRTSYVMLAKLSVYPASTFPFDVEQTNRSQPEPDLLTMSVYSRQYTQT